MGDQNRGGLSDGKETVEFTPDTLPAKVTETHFLGDLVLNP